LTGSEFVPRRPCSEPLSESSILKGDSAIIFVVVPVDHWHDVATNQQQQKVIVPLQVID
jgi:hypothetical protein